MNLKEYENQSQCEEVCCRKSKGLTESVDMTEDNEIHKENELRTKRRFDSCKIKGDEVVVLNSCSVIYCVKYVLTGKHKQGTGSVYFFYWSGAFVEYESGCASIMGHYTVRNFDADRMVLNLHHGDIPINRQVIQELLGLPLGNVTIKFMTYREVTDDIIIVWKKQSDDEDNIRPRVVQQVIMQTTRADLLYKVNIFVLLCNTLESVRCDSVNIVRGRPAICFWNVEKLCERERVECRTIGLGMGELQEPFQVINESSGTSNVGQEKVQGNDAGGVKISDGRCKGNQGEEIFSGSGESVETTISTIKEMHDMLVQQKKVLEDKINDVVKKYPENQLVKEWKNKFPHHRNHNNLNGGMITRLKLNVY
uniref:Uncharacterized protein n=1 Tax=Lactuca sativa TaxID=4236 RepID=A0A9R1UVI4_LACSA|nr:hypothetical protein LSAT_V11C800426000 [Lactuca sativa]